MPHDAHRLGQNGGARSLDDRVVDLEEWRVDSARATEERDEKLFVLLNNMHADIRSAANDSRAAYETSTLVAAQFHATNGNVSIAQTDIDAVRDRLRAVETRQQEVGAIMAAPHSERPSFHDLDDTQRKAIMSANDAAKAIAEEAAARHANTVRLEREREERTKAEAQLVVQDARAHGYKMIGVEKVIGAFGVLIVAMGTVIWWLLTHGR